MYALWAQYVFLSVVVCGNWYRCLYDPIICCAQRGSVISFGILMYWTYGISSSFSLFEIHADMYVNVFDNTYIDGYIHQRNV